MAKMLLNGSYDPERDGDPYGEVLSFRKTSPVDLTQQDMYGWNAMHHVVAPLANYTFCCPAMLQLLVHVGTPLDAPDSNGVTPLQLAAARGVASITHALQVIVGVLLVHEYLWYLGHSTHCGIASQHRECPTGG